MTKDYVEDVSFNYIINLINYISLLFPTPICPQARRSLYCYLQRKPYRKGRIKTSNYLSEPTV
jgi:hypothetical protein